LIRLCAVPLLSFFLRQSVGHSTSGVIRTTALGAEAKFCQEHNEIPSLRSETEKLGATLASVRETMRKELWQRR